MNTQILGLVREFLAAVSAALIAYGVGSDALWQEVAGGVIALITLIWGITHHTGAEAWFSLVRKVLSSVAGVLVLQGTISADKMDLVVGSVISALSLVWSLYGKIPADGPPSVPPVVPLLLLCCGLSCLLPSCGSTVAVSSPWGDAVRNPDGSVVITPRPLPVVVIPAK